VVRRHFRVTEAWWLEEPHGSSSASPSRSLAVPSSTETALAPLAARWTPRAIVTAEGGLPRVELRLEPPAPPSAAPSVPTPLPTKVAEIAHAGLAPGSPEASRVMVSLLARLWLLSNARGPPGGVAAPQPAPLSPPQPPPPEAPAPPVPRSEPLLPPAPPSPELPAQPPVLSTEDTFPRSGLGEFLVEVARASEVPVAVGTGASSAEPPERVTVMIELPRQLRCHRYQEDNPVSRDRCRLFDRIEKPEASEGDGRPPRSIVPAAR